jgi:hypothetical protein
VPDLAVYNLAAGINDELDGQMALVRSTGQVYWSRPGVMQVLCRFSGLVAFPYDVARIYTAVAPIFDAVPGTRPAAPPKVQFGSCSAFGKDSGTPPDGATG